MKKRRKKSKKTAVEHLMKALQMFRSIPGIVEAENTEEVDIANLKLAMEVEKRGNGFMFRAIIEEWTVEDLVREVY